MKRFFMDKATFRYAGLGFLIGCLFPIFGTLLAIWSARLPFGWASIVEAQTAQVLLWIIDSAPLVLAVAFGFAGKRAESLLQIKDQLEQTVSARVSELQNVNQALENQMADRTAYENQLKSAAEDLQLISQVARAMSLEQDLEKLLPLTTRLVSERFGFYHVGIFLIDETKSFAILKASNSKEGHHMLEHGHRLEVGQVGIVGDVAATGLLRIASDVGQDALYFNNPNLPETRSEIALPLLVRRNIIGVIDVQSKDANAFSMDRAKSLSILADQIAIAIENSRLFSEIQRALSEAQAFSRQFSSQAWKKIAMEQQIGYLHTSLGDKKLTEPVDWDEGRQAIIHGEMVVISADENSEHEPALAIPLRIREQTIGVLDIRSSDPNRHWQEEEITVIQAIADRVGLALENARLFEETTGRANRERTVSEITTHLRSTSDPDEMLQTALDELKNALGARDVQIRPYNPPGLDQIPNQQPLPNTENPTRSIQSI